MQNPSLTCWMESSSKTPTSRYTRANLHGRIGQEILGEEWHMTENRREQLLPPQALRPGPHRRPPHTHPPSCLWPWWGPAWSSRISSASGPSLSCPRQAGPGCHSACPLQTCWSTVGLASLPYPHLDAASVMDSEMYTYPSILGYYCFDL